MRLIDANKLKETINDFYDNNFRGLVPNELIKYAQAVDSAINNAPTVEPIADRAKAYNNGYANGYKQGLEIGKGLQRPQGEWLSLTPPDMRTYTNDYFKVCDKCNIAARFVSSELPYKFCPNCGAKMQKGGNR